MMLKNTCKQLSWWSKNNVGNIFLKIKELEGKIVEVEDTCFQDNSDINRMQLNNVNDQLISSH